MAYRKNGTQDPEWTQSQEPYEDPGLHEEPECYKDPGPHEDPWP